MPREFARHLRVGAELQRFLNELLQSEVKDPRLANVRVSEVDVSSDLSVAKVFYAPLAPDADRAPIESALTKAAPFMRGRVGRELRVRKVPELRFEHDDSVRQGFEISRLIRETRATDSDDESA